jgi:hypothetical protein
VITAAKHLFIGPGVGTRTGRILVTIVLLACILTIVVLPNVDLLPTILRAQHTSFHLLTQLASLVLFVWVRFQPPALGSVALSRDDLPLKSNTSRLAVTCVQRC